MKQSSWPNGARLVAGAGVCVLMMCIGACTAEVDEVGMYGKGAVHDAHDVERAPRYESSDLRERLERGVVQRVLLKFEHGADGAVLERVRAGELGEVEQVASYESFQMLSVSVQERFELEALEQLEGLVSVHEDLHMSKHVTAALSLIDQPGALSRQAQLGAGRAVVVLDTGTDWTHPDFGTCTAPGSPGCRVVHAQDFATEDGALDEDGHGTNVAAIVARVAPDVDIIALDVFDGDVASSSTILAALNWVVANQSVYDIGVVNMSLGSGYYTMACQGTAFAAAMQSLRQQGIIPVASSGNDGFTDGLGVPACDPDVVSVGASYDRALGGVLYTSCADATSDVDQVACFSNTAHFLDVVAPGVGMSAGGWTMSGTSQAAPVVSAALAIVQAAYPHESVDESIARLKGSAVVTDVRTGASVPRVHLTDMLDAPVPCEYSASVMSVSRDATAGSVVFDVTAGDGCEWSVSVSESWASVDGATRHGSGVVEVMCEENMATTARHTDVSFAGQVVRVTQEGAPEVVDPPEEDDRIDVSGWLMVNWWRDVTRWRSVPVVALADGGDATITQMCVSVASAEEAFGEGLLPVSQWTLAGGAEPSCESWTSYSVLSFVELPDADGEYEVRVWFRDAQGRTSRGVMKSAVVLDRVAPVAAAGRLMQGAQGWELDFGAASDEGSGVAMYRVFVSEGRVPPNCVVWPWSRVVYQSEEPGVARVELSESGQPVFFRVCAYDRAGNFSVGAVTSTQDEHGF